MALVDEFSQGCIPHFVRVAFGSNIAVCIEPYRNVVQRKLAGQPDVIHRPEYVGDVKSRIREKLRAYQYATPAFQNINVAAAGRFSRFPAPQGKQPLQAVTEILDAAF